MELIKAYSIASVCAATSFGRTLIFAAIRNGDLKAKKVGRRTIILEADLSAWLNSRPDAGGSSALTSSHSNDRGMP
jgi:hypothetical protein